MALLTQLQMNRIPSLYSQENTKDSIVYLKITCMQAVWLITELDQEQGLAFGYCYIHEGELGYVSLEEIEDLKSQYRINIFEIEKPLSQMKKELGI